jgi:elongation factor Ts
MQVSAQQVKELRERTGAGMMDCKAALAEAGGDLEKAVDVLRKKGLAAAARKSGRVAADGLVHSYIHAGGKLGVLVEVNCETDFVARTDGFQELVKDIAMHIAAAEPRFVRREEVTADVLERERAIYSEQAAASGKPPAVVEKIVAGKLDKFYAEACLLEQPFVKNPDQTVGQLVQESVAKIGENIQVRRFVRFKLGEGIEKRSGDLAAEVAATLAGQG